MVLEENPPEIGPNRVEKAAKRSGGCWAPRGEREKMCGDAEASAGVAGLAGRRGASCRKSLHFLDGSTLWALVPLVNQAGDEITSSWLLCVSDGEHNFR